jgi:hypothetical protein
MKPPFGNPDLSHDPWMNEPAVTCSAQRRGGRRWPWMQKLSAWGSLAGASGRFTLNRLELRSWAVLEIHVAGAGADDILDDLPFERQSFLNASLFQWSGLYNCLGFCFGCYVGQL